MRLERAGEADHPAVVALANRAYRGTGEVRSWNVEDVIRGDCLDAATLRAELADRPDAILLVHRDPAGGEVIACVMLAPGAAGGWHLGLLAIDPARQTGGMGSRMLAAAEGYARERGATRVDISVVHVRASLLAWYERRGYVRTGATAPWPYGDGRYGTPLVDDLHFVLLAKPL